MQAKARKGHHYYACANSASYGEGAALEAYRGQKWLYLREDRLERLVLRCFEQRIFGPITIEKPSKQLRAHARERMHGGREAAARIRQQLADLERKIQAPRHGNRQFERRYSPPMSEESVEITKRTFEAFNAGDMDALRGLYDPDIVFRHLPDWPEPGPTVGRDEVIRFIESLRDTWDATETQIRGEIIHAADRVVVSFTWRGAGHGPQSNIELTTLSPVRNGKVREVEYFRDRAQALEVAGLAEGT
jgi:uncharacterized protein